MSKQLISTRLSSLLQLRFAPAVVLSTGLAFSLTLPTSLVLAGQLPNGRVTFDHAPRLVGASTTQPAAFVSDGTYTFTLTVPQDAGAPLQAVTLSQVPNAQKIEFAVNQSRAIANGETVPLASVGGTSSDAVTIAFAQPIQPGSTVTISLQAVQNSGSGGVYLFGITAYPVGDQTSGLFLGYGRVTLFSHGG